MSLTPDFDFETYSEAGYYYDITRGPYGRWRAPDDTPKNKAGLGSVGSARYAEHPSTEVLSLAYDIQDGNGPRLWTPDLPPPYELFNYLARPDAKIEAFNWFFEFVIWHYVCSRRMGWPELPYYKFRCAQAKAAAYGLPGDLENVAKVLQVTEQKDSRGEHLIKKLSVPRTPTKTDFRTRLTPADSPQLFADFYQYNIQDIKAEGAVSAAIPDLSPLEFDVWQMDQRINIRGVQIDMEGLENCKAVMAQVATAARIELITLTGIPDITVDKLDQLKGWMAGRGVRTASLDADHVDALLKRQDLPPDVKRVIEIRASLGAANVKKLYAISRSVNDDGRVRGLYAYCGARQTGRWAGRGAQPQNITSGGPDIYKCPECGGYYWAGLPVCRHCWGAHPEEKADWCPEAAELVLEDLKTRDSGLIAQLWGDPIKAISGCLRSLFVAGPDRELICSDYSAIEAVVLAALAGEEWRLEVFRTHGKIYEMSAAKTSGVPFEEILEYKERNGKHHPLRKKLGKVGELASGYAGWIGAWKNFGAGDYMTDDEIKAAILAWRAESPAIVEFWGGQWRKHPDRWEWWPELYGIEGAAVSAILNPGYTYEYRGIKFFIANNILHCQLLSGRCLLYHQPRLIPDVHPAGHEQYKIAFMGWNSDASQGPKGWTLRYTYGGRLTENITQATARDVFAYGMLNADKAGYSIVLHTHDEPTAEVPISWGSVEEFESLINTMPPWAADWPIKAVGGWRGHRYRKD